MELSRHTDAGLHPITSGGTVTRRGCQMSSDDCHDCGLYKAANDHRGVLITALCKEISEELKFVRQLEITIHNQRAELRRLQKCH